jgi:hypothetical protein
LATTSSNGVVLNALGGRGGNQLVTSNEAEGPGGGGGGGYIASAATLTRTITGGVNGTTTSSALTEFPPNGATRGGIGLLDNVGSLSGGCFAATRAGIGGLEIGDGAVEFVTASQRGTAGFYVWAFENGSWRRLRDTLERAAVPDTINPTRYHVEGMPAGASWVLVEEVETSGRRRFLGPFAAGDASLAATLHAPREGRRARARSAPAALPRSDPGPVFALKIVFARAGLAQVPLVDLVRAGLPPGALSRLRVTRLGQAVPFTVSPGNAPTLRFRVQGLSTDYTDQDVYVVSWGGRAEGGPLVPLTRSGPALLPGRVRIQQDRFYAPFLPRPADPWIWEALTVGEGGPFDFDLPEAASATGEVAVRIYLSGGSEATHTVAARIGGLPVGTVTFSGRTTAALDGVVPAFALRASGNEISFTYTAEGAKAEDFGLVFFDGFDLGLRPLPSEEPVAPSRLAVSRPEPLRLAGADYLILTHARFHDAASRIAKAKQAEGFRAEVLDVERAYDRFSGGVVEAEAVAALIREAARQAPVRYVLLIGDDTFDPKDHLGLGSVSYVPSLLGWDGQFARVPSENLYADLDRDGAPEVAIGRLPASTEEEADALAEKIDRAKELLGRPFTHLLGVDNGSEGDVSFRGEAEAVTDSFPASAPRVFADLTEGAPPARAAFLQAFRDGAHVVHYFGHASPETLADEGLFRAPDAAALVGAGHATVVFVWACEAQWYQYHLGPTVDEALLLARDGGALVVVGPAGISDPTAQEELSRRLYPLVLRGVPLGEALRQAKAAVVAERPSALPAVVGWSLLGDPSLRLPAAERQR